MNKNIAVVWGGYSSEKVVSEKSAEGISSFIDKDRYNIYKVRIDRESWMVEYNNDFIPVDKNDFSFVANEEKIVFDFVYNTIHGTPGEDGLLQGYFDMLGIPYSNCGVLASAITFNKYTSNNFLKNFGIKVADSILLRKGDNIDIEAIGAQLGLPVFVKPNVGGSSFATNKVKDAAKMMEAINESFIEAPEVIIESFVKGVEVTCGCFETEKGLTVLPLTEVVTQNEFFDYGAKYLGEVEEITPARISEELTHKIQSLTKQIYKLIGAKGIIRADYIIREESPVLLEVNTTPGMTTTSFIPQQVKAAGLEMKNVMTEIIETEINKLNSTPSH
ncbi:D-alanine-D-alanine ligase [Fermentimonas caenicola]|uniref:D-alanine--D-alanine ligase n=1 Tax=Fermentimonas caenicola TaxID=1562970 RepID=A0A098BZC6_9BACT|nr:D-alanine-D-alanine ligase [Fermentimonas caenicola]